MTQIFNLTNFKHSQHMLISETSGKALNPLKVKTRKGFQFTFALKLKCLSVISECPQYNLIALVESQDLITLVTVIIVLQNIKHHVEGSDRTCPGAGGCRILYSDLRTLSVNNRKSFGRLRHQTSKSALAQFTFPVIRFNH